MSVLLIITWIFEVYPLVIKISCCVGFAWQSVFCLRLLCCCSFLLTSWSVSQLSNSSEQYVGGIMALALVTVCSLQSSSDSECCCLTTSPNYLNTLFLFTVTFQASCCSTRWRKSSSSLVALAWHFLSNCRALQTHTHSSQVNGRGLNLECSSKANELKSNLCGAFYASQFTF